MQMIFYLLITIFTTIAANGYDVFLIIQNFIQNGVVINFSFIWKCIFIIIYGINITMSVVLVQFFKFHVKLVLENKTTIETLDHKGQEYNSKYDLGKY